MDLVSATPFWPILNGLPRSYPKLGASLRCEVVVIGAGISGALVADTLASEGRDVVIIDRRDVASGSTRASTALLQYEIDVSLSQLGSQIGTENAARAYRACARSIELIGDRVASLGVPCGFERKQSVYLASSRRDARKLPAECRLRLAAGLDVELWGEKEIAARFSFSSPAALRSTQAAQVDPYRLTHALLARAVENGARVFDRMAEAEITSAESSVVVKCGDVTLTADWVVVAAGYESVKFLPKRVVNLKSSFAVVSEPLLEFPGWWDRCLLWETADPYFYMRTTADSRALIGGEDDSFRNPARRDARVTKKAERLERTFRRMFPQIPFETAYAWGGTFGETKDGLAYIGADTDEPRVLFACGFGGNGITYSALAAEIVADCLRGEIHPDADLFRLDR